MHETKRSVFRMLTCVISSILLASTGKTENLDVRQSVNRTRGNSPVSEFRSLMLRAISTLSITKQCTILIAILEESGEDPSSVMKEFMDTVPYHHLPCVPLTTPSGLAVNTSALRRATDLYVRRLFSNLPTAFQCKIISDVTFASRGDLTQEQLPKAMGEIQSELSTKLKLTTEKCADTMAFDIITNTRVQLGVRLRKSMPLVAWLERFKKILPKIYLSYVSKSGRVSEFISGWTTNKNGAKVPDIRDDQFLVRFQGDIVTDATVVMVSFSLYSRTKSGDYRLISGDDVAASLKGLSRSVLNSYIQAEVIGWSAQGEKDSSKHGRMRNRKSKPSNLETYRLKEWLPRYLLKFFKSMTKSGRCYILRQISSYVERDLLVVEKWYHSFGLLPKRYFCSRASKHDSKLKSKRPGPLAKIWERLDKFIFTMSKPTPTLSTTVLQSQNSTVLHETRPFNSMEIVMFALLAFLCLLIMVFVANCCVFTFKTKQLNLQYSTDFETPQLVLGGTDGGRDGDVKNEADPPEKLTLIDNPQSKTSVISGGDDSPNHKWRLLSMTNEGGVTVCSDVISLSEDEPERVSSI